MSNIKRFGIIVISIILALTGFLKLSNSVQNALDSTSEYIRSVGGSLDTTTAQNITEGFIISNIVAGGVMFFVGLFFLCLTLYSIYKKFK